MERKYLTEWKRFLSESTDPPSKYADLTPEQKQSFDAWAEKNAPTMSKEEAYFEYGYTKWWLGSVKSGGMGKETEDSVIFDTDKDGRKKNGDDTILGMNKYYFYAGLAVLLGPGIWRIVRDRKGLVGKSAGEILTQTFPIYYTLFKLADRGILGYFRKRAAKTEKGALMDTINYLNSGKTFDQLVASADKEEVEMLKQLRNAARSADITVTKMLNDITKPLLTDIGKGKMTADVVKELLGKNYKKYPLYKTALEIQYSNTLKHGPDFYKNARTSL